MKKRILSTLAFLLAAAVLMGNSMIIYAAKTITLTLAPAVLSDDLVAENLYLTSVYSMNNGNSYVGIVNDSDDYQSYFATSDDLINWELKSNYYSLIYGNDLFVGLKSGEQTICYTADGIAWNTVSVPEDYYPISVKYENRYFKMQVEYRNTYEKTVLLSEDALTWYDIYDDIPENADAKSLIILKDGSLCVKTTNEKLLISHDSLAAESRMWTEVNLAPEYDWDGAFSFDGETFITRGRQIETDSQPSVSDCVYFMTTDFVNWQEKDWHNDDYLCSSSFYYEPYASNSTDEPSITAASGQRLEAVEALRYLDESNNSYWVSYVVISDDGINWHRETINLFYNGNQINKIPAEKTAYVIPAEYEWARPGVDYVIGRFYDDDYAFIHYNNNIDDNSKLSKPATRSYSLALSMNALNILQVPSVPEGFVPFEDVWYDKITKITNINCYSGNYIQIAKMLGLVNGVDGVHFLPYENISRQDMMVILFNLLRYAGNIEPDNDLTALMSYTDKDAVADYAKLAVSSLSKAGIIQGDGIKVNPKSEVTYAEMMTIAMRINNYRIRN